mmetsp:Transcript_30538/g.27054  ORF Transcript_30538/g.27054 Transcript_30538/m.27054 type:complete len:219 (-) Transcript_30538:445-1101(-)
MNSSKEIKRNTKYEENLRKPQNRDRLVMTHNKFYTIPVLSEIREENKSQGSDSYSRSRDQYKSQKQITPCLSEENKNVELNTSLLSHNSIQKDSLSHNINIIKSITEKFSKLLGLNATFEIDCDPAGILLTPKNNLSKLEKDSKNLNLRIILQANREEKLLSNVLNESNTKNNTMLTASKDLKDFFQDQSGARIKMSDEKSLKMRMTESSKSNKEEED